MVVKRKDLLDPLTKKQEKEIKVLEKKIDKIIKEKFDQDAVVISGAELSLTEGPDIRVQREIAELYKEAGWKVDWEILSHININIVLS